MLWAPSWYARRCRRGAQREEAVSFAGFRVVLIASAAGCGRVRSLALRRYGWRKEESGGAIVSKWNSIPSRTGTMVSG